MLRCCLVSCLLIASIISLPHRAAGDVLIGAPATGGDSVPFAGGLQYQQIYNSDQFTTGPVVITGITFFDTTVTGGTIDNTNYTISLSTSSQSVNGLSATFAINRGADVQEFFNGVLSGTLAGTELNINGTPFSYDPDAGNLLLEIVKASDPFESFTISLDRSDAGPGAAAVFSRVLSFNNSGVADSPLDSFGLVTRFETDALVPEPSTLTLACLAVTGLYAHRLRRRRRKPLG